MNFVFKITLFFSLFFACSSGVFAQELHQDIQETLRAKVVTVLIDENRFIPGTETRTRYQELEVSILEGSQKGQVVKIENDYTPLSVGDKLFIHHLKTINQKELFTMGEPVRINSILFYSFLFLLVIILFGGIQGLRGLVSLLGSLLLIMYVLLPSILGGASPVFVSIIVASLIVIVGSYITHGFNRVTSSAVLGMIITVIISGLLSSHAIDTAKLTGFSDDESVYLNLNSSGTLDIAGVLLSGILIGLLGVLYDSAIGQSVAVDELYKTDKTLTRRQLFKKATRIGREHIGALVTALAIAYVGASLPLLLLFYSSGISFVDVINREVFATEIIRTLIGSIGLVLAVPITTLISVFMLRGRDRTGEEEKIHVCSHGHRH